MAIYHLSAKLISRKSGRTATAAAAYRAGEKITDERTGEVHDYTQKRGVEHAEVVMPAGADWTPGRAELWNAVEAKNKRADAQVAREFVVALPDELDGDQRRQLALGFARHIADTHQVAADVAIHAPGREGDHRNHHAHILTTTNTVKGRGLGNKARALDLVAHNMGGGAGTANAVDKLRQTWADMANHALERAGRAERIDHRSLDAQGIDRLPTQHMGPAVAGMVRRGASSEVARRMAEEADARLSDARETGRIERELDRSILDLSGDLDGAIREREERQREAERPKRAERPGESVEQAYRRIRGGYYDAERDAWRQRAAKLHEENAAEARKLAESLRSQEPRRILGFWEGRWKTWNEQLDEAGWQERLSLKRAKETLDGEYDHGTERNNWSAAAGIRMEREHPELCLAYQREEAEKARKGKELAERDRAEKLAKIQNRDRPHRPRR